MSEHCEPDRPLLWILDSERRPLADCREVFSEWADCLYIPAGHDLPDWEQRPDAVFFSAEIAGGATGGAFASLVRDAGATPLLAVARLRSLAQAVAYFRAGAADYLSIPLEEEDVKERFVASLERAARLAIQSAMVEFEQADADAVGLIPAPDDAPVPEDRQEEDILAHLPGTGAAPDRDAAAADSGTDGGRADAPLPSPENDEPVAVDGLPIPSLWEELPCGLLVFDSLSNLVFSNRLGLQLFGHESLAELQETLECRRGSFAAHGANHKPLADNQWPHVLALKARAARGAVVSLEKPDRRRTWLRIDCMPHLTDGKVSRLSMTLVNLTGELPPLAAAKPAPAPVPKCRKQRDKKKR